LDQFLEHLIDIGVEKIVRIGGQSKSEVVEGKNLRTVSRGEAKTKSEGYLLAKLYEELEGVEKSITRKLKSLHSTQKHPQWANVKSYLEKWYPRIFAQFSRVDSEGFETVGKDPFDLWMSGETNTERHISDGIGSSLAIEVLLDIATQDAYLLPLIDRGRLMEHWAREIREESTDGAFESIDYAEIQHRLISDLHDEVDRRVLQTADVIGVTTTGLAKRVSTLKRIRVKVVICEEAGEVMEPHILSAMLPNVEHFIQIGDHQQLRPQINNYELSLECQQGLPYQLDRSQFERLSRGERGRPRVPLAQLNVQRRMRPEISSLVRETIYPQLIDHDTTKHYPDVVGMRKNVFWLDHDNTEEGSDADMHQKSHSNVWEVEFTHALVRHIVRQGKYKSSQIAVLTPYTGQLQKLRTKMRSEFEIILSERDQETLAKDGFEEEAEEGLESGALGHGKLLEKKKLSELLRIATVDNFQGEEAQIVIISLVRSNMKRKVGFLKTENRINVLLSRAQHGMYLIGNTETYANVGMWAKVLGMLEMRSSVGKALGLCCPRHPDTEIQVRQPDDFARFSPEGGCQLPCDRRLSACGHRCQAKCHSESMHQAFPCPQPCQRLHSPCNHSCQKATCGEDCGSCLVRLDNVQLPCSHLKDDVPCYKTQDIGKIECVILVEKLVPDCGHAVKVQCRRNVTSLSFSCPTPCKALLPCGHGCPGFCGRCYKKDPDDQPIAKHQACSKICGRPFATCNHTCQMKCHFGEDCRPCELPCAVRYFKLVLP
jgi:AAA domain